jgi:Kef-type K+ transport system membrane component KefB
MNTQRLFNKLGDPKYYLMYYFIYVIISYVIICFIAMVIYEFNFNNLNDLGKALSYTCSSTDLLFVLLEDPITNIFADPIGRVPTIPLILNDSLIIILIIWALFRFKADKKKKYIFQRIIFIFILILRLLMLTIYILDPGIPQF